MNEKIAVPEEENTQWEETLEKDEAPSGPPDAPAPEEIPEDLRAFFQECLTASLERDEYKDKYMRLAAEYDNYRKRTQREKNGIRAEARAAAAEKFLPVYDNLARALTQATQDTAFLKGVELIFKGLLDTFEKLDIKEIEALGQPFDPAVHNAVMHVEDDSGEVNLVAEVFQAGFLMGERVLRHAVVKVKN